VHVVTWIDDAMTLETDDPVYSYFASTPDTAARSIDIDECLDVLYPET